MSLIYRIENTNKKYKEEDIDGKYVDTELEIEVKNEKYVAGREGSKKYLILNLKMEKMLSLWLRFRRILNILLFLRMKFTIIGD